MSLIFSLRDLVPFASGFLYFAVLVLLYRYRPNSAVFVSLVFYICTIHARLLNSLLGFFHHNDLMPAAEYSVVCQFLSNLALLVFVYQLRHPALHRFSQLRGSALLRLGIAATMGLGVAMLIGVDLFFLTFVKMGYFSIFLAIGIGLILVPVLTLIFQRRLKAYAGKVGSES